MNCKEVLDLLSEYIDGELDERERALLSSHLEECSDCRKELEAMKTAISMVQGLGEVEVPAEVSSALRKIAIAEENPQAVQSKRNSKGSSLRYLVAATAVTAAALIALLPFAYKDLANISANKASEPMRAEDQKSLRGAEQAETLKTEETSGYGKKSGNEQLLTEAQDKSQKSGATSSLDTGTWPEVAITDKEYSTASADELLAGIKGKTEGIYTVKDAKDKRETTINDIVNKLNEKGIKGELMRSPINGLLDQTKRDALPVYVEKAKFDKQDCWVIVIRWGFGGEDNNLYKTSLYVTDPSGWKIFYYTSK